MKKSVSLSLVSLLLVALCASGGFADSLSEVPVVSQSPSFQDLSSSGLLFASSPDRSDYYYVGASSSNTATVFCGLVPSGNNIRFACACVSDEYQTVYWNSGSSVRTISVNSYQTSRQGVYFILNSQLSVNTLTNTYIPSYASLDSFLDSVQSYASVIGESVSYSIPSGYALIVQPVSGDVEIIERSYSIFGSWSFPSLDYPDVHKTNGAIERNLSSSYLIDGFSPDRVFGQYLIPWSASNTNPSGSSSNYSFIDGTDIILSQFGDTFVITNPIYYGYGDVNSNITRQNSVDIDVNLSIQYSSRPTFRLIALESLQDLTNGQFHYYSVFRPEVYDEYGTPSVNGDSTTVVFPSAPSGGGNTGQLPVDDDASLIGFIQRFTSRVRELFNSVSSAVQTLFSSGSTFMQRLADIFSWIPEPVSVVLVSAFIVVIVVGLLKIFL